VFSESDTCAIEAVCVLKDALAEARDAFLAALERYTLADLIAPRRKLTALS
jgi:Rrf2 family nitric oxide-sensitive transcriptional repressor